MLSKERFSSISTTTCSIFERPSEAILFSLSPLLGAADDRRQTQQSAVGALCGLIRLPGACAARGRPLWLFKCESRQNIAGATEGQLRTGRNVNGQANARALLKACLGTELAGNTALTITTVT